jgi:hypothetical protein
VQATVRTRKLGKSNQYARRLTVTCSRKRDERVGGTVWFGSLARSTPEHVKRFLTSSLGGTCLAWLLLPPTYIHHRTCIPHYIHLPAIRGPPTNSKNAIYRRLLPGRLPFLQHRQCLPGRDIPSTSEPRPRPRLTSGSCHSFDAACNGVS